MTRLSLSPTRYSGCTILAALLGCGTGGSMNALVVPTPARGAPERFEPLDRSARLMPADTIIGSGCLSPMVDPRDEYQVRFTRAGGGVADYRVPDGRYGVGPGQLLRLECNSGRVLGVVRE